MDDEELEFPEDDLEQSDFTDLKAKLEKENIDTSNIDFQSLFDAELNKLLGELGVSKEPVKHQYTLFNWDSSNRITLPLSFVSSICNVSVDNSTLQDEDYFFISNLGILQFAKHVNFTDSIVNIVYSTCLSDEFLLVKIYPLVYDILLSNLLPSHKQNVTSLKEGDVQVNYDSNYTLVAYISNRKAELKKELIKPMAVII